MKRSRAVLALLAVAVFGAMPAAAKKAKKEAGGLSVKAALQPAHPVLTDFQGRSEGKAVPSWVMQVADGEYKAAAKALGLEGKKVFFCVVHGVDKQDMLTAGKIESFEEVIGTIERMAYDQNAVVAPQYTARRVEASMSGEATGATQSIHLESYSPFGFRELSVSSVEGGEAQTKQAVIGKVVYPEWGDHAALKELFGWFGDPANVRTEQLWTELKQPSGEIQYHVYTVLSMEQTAWESLCKRLIIVEK